jgi:arsenate reductase
MQNDSMKKNVLFLCTHNAVRSQIAEAFLNHLYGDRYSAFSAGSDPTQIDPLVVTVMKETGMDLSANQSKSLSVFQGIILIASSRFAIRFRNRVPLPARR